MAAASAPLRDAEGRPVSSSAWDRELEDPIFEIRGKLGRWSWRAFWLLVLTTVIIVLFAFIAPPDAGVLVGWCAIGTGFGWFLWLTLFGTLIWWRAFAPQRTTDIFYLRSFQNDPNTWSTRVAIQQAIGRRRLSGIRDPRRREMSIWDGLSPLFVAMKYCTPRYMDLEAGRDWKARLWHSLQRGGIAVIDLSLITPFVLEEIQLAVAALGRERVILLGRTPQQKEELLQITARELGLRVESCDMHAILWPCTQGEVESPARVKAFREEFRRLMDQLEQTPKPEPSPAQAFCGSLSAIAPRDRKSEELFWRMIGVQVVFFIVSVIINIVIAGAVADPATRSRASYLASAPIFVLNTWLLLQNWLVYIYDVGIWRDRLKASVGLVFTVGSLIPMGYVVLLGVNDSSYKEPRLPAVVKLTPEELQADRLLLQEEDQRRTKKISLGTTGESL